MTKQKVWHSEWFPKLIAVGVSTVRDRFLNSRILGDRFWRQILQFPLHRHSWFLADPIFNYQYLKMHPHELSTFSLEVLRSAR